MNTEKIYEKNNKIQLLRGLLDFSRINAATWMIDVFFKEITLYPIRSPLANLEILRLRLTKKLHLTKGKLWPIDRFSPN